MNQRLISNKRPISRQVPFSAHSALIRRSGQSSTYRLSLIFMTNYYSFKIKRKKTLLSELKFLRSYIKVHTTKRRKKTKTSVILNVQNNKIKNKIIYAFVQNVNSNTRNATLFVRSVLLKPVCKFKTHFNCIN